MGTKKKGTRVQVAMMDVDGIPRAWGIAPTAEAAHTEAQRQLGMYIAKKIALGECWHAPSHFRPVESEVLP